MCYIRHGADFGYIVRQVCNEYESLKHQGDRSDLTGKAAATTAEQVGKKFNISGRTVSRYIRLGLLDRGILDFIVVDRLSIRTGEVLSYLPYSIQNVIVRLLLEGKTVTWKQSLLLRELAEYSELSEQTVRYICESV